MQTFLKDQQKHLGFTSTRLEQSYNRNLLFLDYGNETLKTEFTYFPFRQIESPQTIAGIQVDSLVDVATNKLFAIYQRTKARDYIDLYIIVRDHGLTLDQLLKLARIKFDTHIDPVQLGTQMLAAESAADLPRMLIELPEAEWREFYRRQALQLKDRLVKE